MVSQSQMEAKSVKAPPPRIVLIAGPNGVGKSTIGPALLQKQFGIQTYINADTIAAGLGDGNKVQMAIKAGRIMVEQMNELVTRQQSFGLETTLATKSYATWIRGLKQSTDYSIELLFLSLPSVELAIKRVQVRVASGGHAIPLQDIERRFYRGLKNFFHVYTPVVGQWGITDNSNGSTRPVATGRNQENEHVFDEKYLKHLRSLISHE